MTLEIIILLTIGAIELCWMYCISGLFSTVKAAMITYLPFMAIAHQQDSRVSTVEACLAVGE